MKFTTKERAELSFIGHSAHYWKFRVSCDPDTAARYIQESLDGNPPQFLLDYLKEKCHEIYHPLVVRFCTALGIDVLRLRADRVLG